VRIIIKRNCNANDSGIYIIKKTSKWFFIDKMYNDSFLKNDKWRLKVYRKLLIL
jgi:hypothetical protein